MSASRPVRVGVVGCGKKSREDYIPALLEHPQFELVALCDTDPDAAATLLRFRQIPLFKTLPGMLDEAHIDAAVLALPHAVNGA